MRKEKNLPMQPDNFERTFNSFDEIERKLAQRGGGGGYEPDDETIELDENDELKVKHDDTLIIGENGLRVNVDDDTIGINEDEELYVKNGGSGGGLEIVDELPDPTSPQAKAKTLYIKNKPKVGQYDSANKPQKVGTVEYYKLVNYMGLPTSMTYNEETGWYTIEVGGEEYGSHYVFHIPISMMDINKFLSSQFNTLLQGVDTEEEAEYYVYRNKNINLGNNLIVPIEIDIDDIPEKCYAKFNPEEETDIEINSLNNSFTYNRATYELNVSFDACWRELFSIFLNTSRERLIVAEGENDANFIFDNKKITRLYLSEELYNYAPYAIAVRTDIASYEYGAILRNNNGVKSWEIIDYNAINEFSENTIHDENDPRKVTLGFIKDMMSKMDRKYLPELLLTETYTEEDGCIIPELNYVQLSILNEVRTLSYMLNCNDTINNMYLKFNCIATKKVYEEDEGIEKVYNYITFAGINYQVTYKVCITDEEVVSHTLIKYGA